ncbi:MAG: hypothetical protein IK116_04880 [Firmicutes bacterium]|nr:hypothetical protein [Bacillota bacterium]
MTIDPSYIQTATYVVIAVFLLLQLFMSLRPWFIWGLVLPLLFGAAWYCVAKQPLFISELGFTPDAVEIMSHYCKLGIIASLGVLVVCRLLRFLRKRIKAKKREQRLEAKRQRQEEEYLAVTQAVTGLPRTEGPEGADEPADDGVTIVYNGPQAAAAEEAAEEAAAAVEIAEVAEAEIAAVAEEAAAAEEAVEEAADEAIAAAMAGAEAAPQLAVADAGAGPAGN